MMWKTVKIGSMTLLAATVLGGVLFGSDLLSYARSSAGAVRSAVKDSVPIEFELRRARDLLDQIIPEMHANIRLIAQEEVEIGALEKDIAESRARGDQERERLARQRQMLETPQTVFILADRRYHRSDVVEDLTRRLERVKESQVVLAGKEKLLEARHRSLTAARDALERTRSQKALLEDRIEGLESQYRLVQAAAVGSKLDMDHSKLAQTEKLIAQIKNRLDVAERVLVHESRFTQPIPIEVVDEQQLIERVDEFLTGESQPAPQAAEPARTEKLSAAGR